MKRAILFLFLTAWTSAACAEASAGARENADRLKADGRYEEAVAEYKRALAERGLTPAPAPALRDGRPGAEDIAKLHREEIRLRLSAVES